MNQAGDGPKTIDPSEHRAGESHAQVHQPVQSDALGPLWIRCAAEAVLARPGSSTAGVDGMTRFHFKEHSGGADSASLRESLKAQDVSTPASLPCPYP